MERQFERLVGDVAVVGAGAQRQLAWFGRLLLQARQGYQVIVLERRLVTVQRHLSRRMVLAEIHPNDRIFAVQKLQFVDRGGRDDTPAQFQVEAVENARGRSPLGDVDRDLRRLGYCGRRFGVEPEMLRDWRGDRGFGRLLTRRLADWPLDADRWLRILGLGVVGIGG